VAAALRRPIMHLVMTTDSDDEARQLLSEGTNMTGLIDFPWKLLNRHQEPRRSLVMAVTGMLVNIGGQFTVMQIYNTLHDLDPHLLGGVGINAVRDLAKDELSVYTSFGHGFFLMDNVVRQSVQRYFVETEIPRFLKQLLHQRRTYTSHPPLIKIHRDGISLLNRLHRASVE
jgi:hypothetical protein